MKEVLGFEERRKFIKWFNDRYGRTLEVQNGARMALIKFLTSLMKNLRNKTIKSQENNKNRKKAMKKKLHK